MMMNTLKKLVTEIGEIEVIPEPENI